MSKNSYMTKHTELLVQGDSSLGGVQDENNFPFFFSLECYRERKKKDLSKTMAWSPRSVTEQESL